MRYSILCHQIHIALILNTSHGQPFLHFVIAPVRITTAVYQETTPGNVSTPLRRTPPVTIVANVVAYSTKAKVTAVACMPALNEVQFCA